MGTTRTSSVYKFIIFLLWSSCSLWAQEPSVLQTFSQKLASYNASHAPEKVYLQTDKDYYTNGDTLWFKTSVFDGITHAPGDKSRVVYVELVDQNKTIVEQRRIYAGFDGGAGDIVLAQNLEEGNYFLRAYTKYMLNDDEPVFFEKKIPVWAYTVDSRSNRKKKSKKKNQEETVPVVIEENTSSRPSVRFFPEGGNLVTGINSVLGLKVTDEAGNGLALTGKILDRNGTLISMFRTYEFGLGKVSFNANSQTDYFAEIEVDDRTEKYQLPEPLEKGYVLQITNNGESLQLKVSTNVENGLRGALLLGHLRGRKIMEYLAPEQTANSYELKFSTAELDDGVATFTLITPNGEPVCERLVFIENPNNEVTLSVKTDSSNYGFRDKVNIDLAVLDEEGIPLRGNFSVSVASRNSIEEEAGTIKSWLLLNSDLGGTIENPNYFFKEEVTANRTNLLDNLMLTHGWRRFVWHELGIEDDNKKLMYPPEKGLEIRGKTVNSENRTEPLKSAVGLSITKPSSYNEELFSSTEGEFSFGPIIFRDSITAVITAADETAPEKKVAIYLEPSFPNVPVNDSIRFQNEVSTIEVEPAFQEEVVSNKMNDLEYDPKVIKLDEAIGRGKLKTKQQLINEALNERTSYGQALNRIIPDSIQDNEFMSVIDLIERKMAVFVEGQYPDQLIKLRYRWGSPLFLLDGIVVDSLFANQFFGSEILFIDVLRGAGEMAQFGSRGRFGVIAVYTDRGENYEFVQEKELDVAKFTIPGFYRSREFYQPDYLEANPSREKPDYRMTLHWSPNINVSDIEKTKVSFYTGDASGVYTIRVEGMTNDGRPVEGLYSFTVGEKMN